MHHNGKRTTDGGHRFNCLLCDHQSVEAFLDLGKTALANKFLTVEELSVAEQAYPLRVGFCHGCGHVQLTDIVPPAAMFEDYLYISSASDTLKAHLYDLSDVVVERHGLGAKDLVIDIGCNDGTLLSGFRRHDVRVLGVDPAANLAARAEGSGIDRYVGFFNAATAREIVDHWGPARAITATNTFPHVPELGDFLSGIKTALAPGGVFVIEAHYLVDLLEQVAFDTVYHEHVSYWALGPMQRFFENAGMEIIDAERLPIHHGQIRVFVQRRGESTASPRVAELLEKEHVLGINEFATYRRFAEKTCAIKTDLQTKLKQFRCEGRTIVGYGAPAKGSTLLSYLEIGPETVTYIADRSPLKQGRYTPGSHIPIVAAEQLLEDQPDYVLLLAWNFADEILQQQREYRARGGKFVIPVPEVRVV